MPWKILSREYIEKNKWVALRKEQCELLNKKIINDYYVLELQDVACVIVLTKDKHIVLIKEYKHGVQDDIVQLPCGYVDHGETPLQAAKRELLEETGYIAKNWIFIGKRAGSPGRLNHYYHFFVAQDAEKQKEPALEDGESVHVIKCSIVDAERLLKEEHCDLTAATGFFLAKSILKNLE